jgi:hypothetical protein
MTKKIITAQNPCGSDLSTPLELPKTPEVDKPLIGKEARVFADDFAPEAIGRIEKVRGYGSLEAVEIRIHQNQPGPRVRVAFVGQWELIRGGQANG